jgi:hypothetical protein
VEASGAAVLFPLSFQSKETFRIGRESSISDQQLEPLFHNVIAGGEDEGIGNVPGGLQLER